MKLNEKIFEYRKIKNWSQEDLAEKLDVSRQTVSKWETGKAIPELDKLIALAELFNISVDELVKDKFDTKKQDENIDMNKAETFFEKCCRQLKSKKKIIKKVITAFFISIIIIIGYRIISNKIELYNREKDIEKIMNVYTEFLKHEGNFSVMETYNKKENDKIEKTYRKYDMYFADNKKLVKVTEYEGEAHDKIVKQTYIDLSNINEYSYNWKTNTYAYNGVIEVNTDDWSHKIIDNYEFVSPLDKMRIVLNKNYFELANPSKVIAEDKENLIIALEWPKKNIRNYTWSFGNKNSLDKEEVLDLTIIPVSNWIYFYSDNYENDIEESREIISISLTKLDANFDDVKVPELE